MNRVIILFCFILLVSCNQKPLEVSMEIPYSNENVWMYSEEDLMKDCNDIFDDKWLYNEGNPRYAHELDEIQLICMKEKVKYLQQQIDNGETNSS